MVAVSGDRGRPWRYLLEYDGSDRAAAELAAAQGGDVDLLRVPDGAEFAAERLVPGAGWRRTDALTRERWRGAERWFFPVAHERVVELLRRWSELGRLPEPVDFEPDVPADLEATLAAIDDRAAAGATLDPLPPQRAETVRARVLDGSTELSDGWLTGTGNVVVAAVPDLVLGSPADAERVAAAFRGIGADRLLALAGDPDTARLAGQPPGVELAATAPALVAVDDLGLLGPRLFVDAATRAALLDAEDHLLVAGPPAFLALLLDRSVAEARVAFAAHAAEHPDVVTLAAAEARYNTGTARSTGRDT